MKIYALILSAIAFFVAPHFASAQTAPLQLNTSKCSDGATPIFTQHGGWYCSTNPASGGGSSSVFMLKDASNVTSPTALENITGGIVTLTSGNLAPLIAGTGASQSILGSWIPKVFQIVSGSASSPQTTAGPAVKISNYNQIPYTSCGNNSNDVGCNAALSVNSVGSDTTSMANSAIQAGASNGSSTLGSGGQTPDVFAIHGKGVKTDGVGFAAGAYLVGERQVDTAWAQGAEISLINSTNTNCGYIFTGPGQCAGIWLASRGNAGVGDGSALAIGLGDANAHWEVGIRINQNSVSDYDFTSQSSATRSVVVSGSHASGALVVNQNAGYFGLNIFSPSALFHIANAISAPQWTTNGIVIRQDAMTLTDTTSSGTVASVYADLIGAPTFAASASTTYTTAATLTVAPPVAGTNVTITNPYSIFSSGNIKLNGSIDQTANLSKASWTTNGIYFTQSGTLTDTTSSGVVANLYQNVMVGNTINASNVTTYTNGVTLAVGPPVAGTNVTITNALSARFTGTVRFDSGLNMNGSAGQSQTCTVNTASPLTLIFTNGVLTGGTCNS